MSSGVGVPHPCKLYNDFNPANILYEFVWSWNGGDVNKIGKKFKIIFQR